MFTLESNDLKNFFQTLFIVSVCLSLYMCVCDFFNFLLLMQKGKK